jgi:uncharacterized membrane protein YkvA (DUF1232 family)
VNGWLWALAGLLAVYAALVLVLLVSGRRTDARAVAGFVPDCVRLFSRLAADERVPRRHKFALVLAGLYLAVPFDLVPDFIPIAGQLDDALLVALVLRRVARGSRAPLVREHWPGPESSLDVVLRLTGLAAPRAAA